MFSIKIKGHYGGKTSGNGNEKDFCLMKTDSTRLNGRQAVKNKGGRVSETEATFLPEL